MFKEGHTHTHQLKQKVKFKIPLWRNADYNAVTFFIMEYGGKRQVGARGTHCAGAALTVVLCKSDITQTLAHATM